MLAILLVLLGLVQDPEDLPVLKPGMVVQGVNEETEPLVESPGILERPDWAPVRGKTYRLDLSESGPHTIELHSLFFDTYLIVRDGQGSVAIEDDDGLLRTHSRIVIQKEWMGTISVAALSGGFGSFELRCYRGEAKKLTARERRDAERLLSLGDADARDFAGPGWVSARSG